MGISIFFLNASALADNFMTATEIKSTLSGKTCAGEHLRKNYNFKVYFSPDGVVTQVKDNGYKRNGTWSILDSGKRCLEWEGTDIRKCFHIQNNGNKTYTLTKIKKNGDTLNLIQWSYCLNGNTLEQ